MAGGDAKQKKDGQSAARLPRDDGRQSSSAFARECQPADDKLQVPIIQPNKMHIRKIAA